jgi:enoyl-CoA hydratase/carnithine racemase
VSEHVHVADADGVRTISFDRPERRNALDAAMLAALTDAVAAAGPDPDVRVVVIRGAGADFSAGADLEVYRDYGPLEVRRANLDTWMAAFEAIEAVPVPVVASIRGHAIAGGTELLLACDLVVASRTARLGLVEARVGVIPGAGACIRLPRWVGRSAAKELLMLGNPIDAAEGHRLGLVNRLVDDEELEDATRALAAELASRSPLALGAAKRAVNVGSELDQRSGIAYALQEFALLFAGPDQEEGMSAFLEKRRPEFRGA